jgi:hypothetical protein
VVFKLHTTKTIKNRKTIRMIIEQKPIAMYLIIESIKGSLMQKNINPDIKINVGVK